MDDPSLTTTSDLEVPAEGRLLWQDEFSGTALDESKWNREVRPAYTDNNELQAYASAQLNTSAKAAWYTGRVDLRARLPTATGCAACGVRPR